MNNRRKTTKAVLGVILAVTLIATTVVAAITSLLLHQSAEALVFSDFGWWDRKAPMATSGDNVYIAWWTNKTGNSEVMFRASIDNGATFGNKNKPEQF